MSTTDTYTVQVAREGKWWMVRVPDIDGLTQARRLGEVEEMARSLIAITLDVPVDSFATRVELEPIEDLRVAERVDALQAEKDQLDRVQTRVQEAARALARDLAGKGLPLRDVGAVLGVSFQRAQQLTRGAVATGDRSPVREVAHGKPARATSTPRRSTAKSALEAKQRPSASDRQISSKQGAHQAPAKAVPAHVATAKNTGSSRVSR